MPEGGVIFHYYHSQAGIFVRNAASCYPPEKRSRIHLIAIASASYVDDGVYGSIQHYVSESDFVHRFDFIGHRRCQHSTTCLKRAPSADWWDHSFQSPTFKDSIKRRTLNRQRKYGVLSE